MSPGMTRGWGSSPMPSLRDLHRHISLDCHWTFRLCTQRQVHGTLWGAPRDCLWAPAILSEQFLHRALPWAQYPDALKNEEAIINLERRFFQIQWEERPDSMTMNSGEQPYGYRGLTVRERSQRFLHQVRVGFVKFGGSIFWWRVDQGVR